MHDLRRRDLLEIAAGSLLGVTAFPAWAAPPVKKPGAPAKPAAPVTAGGKATHVIYLFMVGAISHLDTFDLKPGREIQGETKGIQTKVPGLLFGDRLPKLAAQAHQLAVIKSLHTATGDHDQGRYMMRTGYKEIASVRHPGLGAWAMKLLGDRKKTLTDNIVVSTDPLHPGAGFLEPSYSPLPIADPLVGLDNTKQPDYLTEDSLGKRLQLIDTFDAGFRKKYPQKQVEAYTEFYRQATTLMSSKDIQAFDLTQEKEEVRKQYGMDRFGQGCLLARRLVENDVRFIEVAFPGWDHHADIYDNLPEKVSILDQAVSALMTDLAAKGLLDTTLVVLTTEFGRTPKINPNAGRDHHPGVFSSLLCGGGIKGGAVYGKSDEDGFRPAENPVKVTDFNATIATAMGLPLDKQVISKEGRPFTVANHGTPIKALL